MAELLATGPVIQALGFALVAFLWQGAAIGVVTAALAAALRRASADTRYAIGCIALAALALAPILTTLERLQSNVRTDTPYVSQPAAAATTVAAGSYAKTSAQLRLDAVAVPDVRFPIVVAVWGDGVMLLGLHLAVSGMAVARMRRFASPLVTLDRRNSLERVARRLSVTLAVRLFESTMLEIPAVIGWLRPAIILPVSAIAGLSPSHFEAILAHELAHIRRRDYLVNMVQRLVETLLFYHPAVWWVSGWIRREREHCCDDVAAHMCGDRVVYAQALHALETLRANAPALAMGARGGELVHRIRRLVDRTPAPLPNWPGGVAMIVPVIAFLTIGSHTAVPAAPATSQPAVQDARPAEAPAAELIAPDSRAPVSRPLQRAPLSEPDARSDRPAQQQAFGSVSGTVTDPLGGTVPGATVALRSQDTLEASTTTTDASGHFAIGNAATGDYDLVVTLAGFRRDLTLVHVTAAQQTTRTIRLQLGSLSEEVTVVGASAVRTPSASAPPQNLQTASDYRSAARFYYDREAFADAEQMLARANELARAGQPEPANAAVNPAGSVRVGGTIKPPVKIQDVRPIYPSADLATGGDSVVKITAIISRDGTVEDAAVTSPISTFDAAALGAVRLWMFTPTVLDGVPVAVMMTVTVNFKAQ